jgi:hypothetical protein
MADRARVPDQLRARMDAAAPESADALALANAGRARLVEVLDLIEQGRGIREGDSGLNAASSELLLADALLTDAAARAAGRGPVAELLRALDFDALAARARTIDEAAR